MLGADAEPATGVELHAWDAILRAPASIAEPDVIDVDMAAILYTSGSTGKPKGVVLSHRNMVAGGEERQPVPRATTPDDVILAALPLSFDAGFSQLTTAFTVGAHVVLLNYLLPRDVRAAVRQAPGHRPDLRAAAVDPARRAGVAGRRRRAACATSPTPAAGCRAPRSTSCARSSRRRKPFLMYGLTEAFRSTYLDPAEVDRRPDSIGKAIPNAEILVVRPDGTPCEPGEEGELVHRGALVALGYWNDPERTAERFKPAPGREPGITTTELAVWSGDTVVKRRGGLPVLRRPQATR